jgi:dimethylglycine dehydrogenase
VTSGTYGYGVNKSLALCYLKNVTAGDAVDVMILGKPHHAVVLPEAPFDPKGVKLRA